MRVARRFQGVTLPKVPGRGLRRGSLAGGSRGSHLRTAPAPAPPGSRAPRRAAAPPPEGIRGRPWPVAQAFFPRPGPADPQRPPAAGSGRGAAGAASHGRGHERGRLRLRERAGDARARLRGRGHARAGPRGRPRPATLKARFHWPISHVGEATSFTALAGRDGSGGRRSWTEAPRDTSDPHCEPTSMSPR